MSASLYRQALSLGLVSSPTEFWTAVKRSGLTPSAWITMAVSSQTQVKPAWVAIDSDDATQCPYCGSRWGHHHDGCPDSL